MQRDILLLRYLVLVIQSSEKKTGAKTHLSI